MNDSIGGHEDGGIVAADGVLKPVVAGNLVVKTFCLDDMAHVAHYVGHRQLVS